MRTRNKLVLHCYETFVHGYWNSSAPLLNANIIGKVLLHCSSVMFFLAHIVTYILLRLSFMLFPACIRTIMSWVFSRNSSDLHLSLEEAGQHDSRWQACCEVVSAVQLATTTARRACARRRSPPGAPQRPRLVLALAGLQHNTATHLAA